MKNKENTKEEKELEQAQALIQAKANEKAQAFLNAYQALCEEHGFAMSPIMTIKPNAIIPDLEVIKM
jgi:hypothetical protein